MASHCQGQTLAGGFPRSPAAYQMGPMGRIWATIEGTGENHGLYGLLLRENPTPAEPPLPVLSEKLTGMACAQADAHPFMC
jgi:hypothetical protein